MRCERCDFQNVKDAAFCAGCGTALQAGSSSYTPAHLTTAVHDLPTTVVEGERKQVTVLFCDLVGSTALAERLGPEAMHALLDSFFAVAVDQVHGYGGTVNQFLGDGFMALFGAPVGHEDHARRGALAALAIQQATAQQRFATGGSEAQSIVVRIGLNSGAVVVGRIGDKLRMDYTAIGDTTNLAARLQQLAEPGTVYITESTRQLIEPYVTTVSAGERHLKGKQTAVSVYRLTGTRRPKDGSSVDYPVGSALVGRDAEVGLLTAAIARLRRGQGSMVAVLGEAGIGKSRLLAEVCAAAGREVRWLEGRALSFGSRLTYWPFLDILRGAATIADDETDAHATSKLEGLVRRLFPEDPAGILPYLSILLSLPVPAELQHRVTFLDGQSIGLQVFRSVLLLFERLARERPLVVVFEDLHWADQSSVDLLDHVLPLVTSVPLLFIVAGRPERGGAVAKVRSIAPVKVGPGYAEIVLSPLSESSSAALIDNLVRSDGSCARFKQAALERAEGNPFFLEEIVRTVMADGLLEWNPRDGLWRATRASDQIRLPDSLRDVIAARIDRLDPEAKQLLKVASVIGRSFLYRVLRAVSDAGDRLDGHLQNLLSVALIRVKQRTPELEYFFKHALIQEVAYDTILATRRHDLHRRVGECLERIFADRLDDFSSVVAYHYASAEAWEKAQEYLFKAGDQSGRIAGDAEALAHYQQAIDAYERAFGDTWAPLQRATLERKMAAALFWSGQHERALAYVLTAKGRLHRPLTVLPTSKWGIRWAIGQEIVGRIGRTALARLWRPRPTAPVDPLVLDEIARLGELTGWIDYFLHPERFLLQALAGLAYFERRPHAIGLIYNHLSIGLICDAVSAFGLAHHHHREALTIATENGQPIALGHAHMAMGIHAHSLGRLDAAVAEYEESAGIFRGIGHIRGWGGVMMLRAWAHEDQGDFERALSYAESISAVGDETSDPQVRAWGLLRRGVAKRYTGRVTQAIADLETAVSLSKQIPDYPGLVQGLAVLGLCHLDRGDRAQARRLLDEANGIRRERSLRGIWVAYAIAGAAEASITELDASPVRSRSIRKSAGRACRDARRLGNHSRHWLPAGLRLQGNLHWRNGKRTAAERCWHMSVEAAEAVGARYQLALAKAEIGMRLNQRTPVEQAAVLFEQAGAWPDLERVRRLLIGRRDATRASVPSGRNGE